MKVVLMGNRELKRHFDKTVNELRDIVNNGFTNVIASNAYHSEKLDDKVSEAKEDLKEYIDLKFRALTQEIMINRAAIRQSIPEESYEFNPFEGEDNLDQILAYADK